MTRIIFCGSRDWTDRDMIRAAVRRYIEQFGPFELIHGGARGADSIAAVIGGMLGLLGARPDTLEAWADAPYGTDSPQSQSATGVYNENGRLFPEPRKFRAPEPSAESER